MNNFQKFEKLVNLFLLKQNFFEQFCIRKPQISVWRKAKISQYLSDQNFVSLTIQKIDQYFDLV